MMTRSLLLAALALAAPTLAAAAQVEVVNDTSLALMEFYAVPADSGTSGDDILGAEVVAPGESSSISVPDGQCAFDFRSVFEDGSEKVETHDVCAAATYTIGQG